MGKAMLMLLVAGALLALARYAWWPARTYRQWWVALFATELGYVWAVPSLVLASVAGWGALGCGGKAGDVTTAWVAGLAGGMALAAAAGFARPIWTAWRMSGAVDRDLMAVFGPGEPLWSWRRLGRWPTAVEGGEVRAFMAGERAVDFYPASDVGETNGGAPCVVLVHGGGWDGGDRKELAAFNHWLAAHGVAVVVFEYRLAPAFRWPAQRDDVREVVDWVRKNATRLGIDPDQLTLVGRSAGAQIAAATAYAAQPLPGVRAVVALYGVHNLEFVWSIRSPTDSLNSDRLMQQYLGGPPEGERAEQYRQGSAELLAHAGAPKTLIVHGALDELVWCRHSEKLAAALARVGVPHVFVRLPWATHAGEANLHGPSGQLITGAVLRVAGGR